MAVKVKKGKPSQCPQCGKKKLRKYGHYERCGNCDYQRWWVPGQDW